MIDDTPDIKSVEEWKQHPVYTRYDISTLGRIRRNVDGFLVDAGNILEGFLNDKGYRCVTLQLVEGGSVYRRVHQLVVETFVMSMDDIPKGHTINHINHVKDDNRLENLEGVPHSYNVQQAHDLGLVNTPRGEKHGNSKLTKEDVLEIRRLHEDGELGYQDIADMFGVGKTCIHHIVNRRNWKHI